MFLYKGVNDVFDIPKKLAHNVLAVTEIFLRPTRKNAEHFYGRKKMCYTNPCRGRKPEHGFV
jgi:hypothetical protein